MGKHKIKVIVFVVSFAAFLGPFSQSIYTPILSNVAHHFGSSQMLVNFSLSIYTMTLAIMQIIYGPLTDRIGRRKVLITGIIIYIAATIGCHFIHDINFFLIFRSLQAAGIASGLVVGVTVIGDLCQGQELGRAMGTYQMLVSLAPVAGPVVGGIIWGIGGYQALIFLLFIFGSAILLANFVFLKETKTTMSGHNRVHFSSVLSILRHPIGIAIILLGFIQYYTFFTFLVFFPEILVEQYGLTTSQKGLSFLPLSCCIVLGTFIGGRIIEKFNVYRYLILIASFNVIAIVLTVCSAEISFLAAIVSSALFGLCLGLSFPVQTTMLSTIFINERATAIGVYNFVRFTGIAISPIIGGVLYHWGKGTLLFSFVSILFACAVWFIKVKFTQAQKSGQSNDKIAI